MGLTITLFPHNTRVSHEKTTAEKNSTHIYHRKTHSHIHLPIGIGNTIISVTEEEESP